MPVSGDKPAMSAHGGEPALSAYGGEPALSAFSDEPAFPADAIEVGRVIGAWGLKGWIRVLPHAKVPQALFSSKRWFTRPTERPTPGTLAVQPPPLLRVTLSKTHGDSVVASAQEIPDRSAAEALKGVRIYVARTSFPTAGDDEFYWIDLIGLSVVNRDGQVLGTVTDLLDTGAQSVLRVQPVEAAGDAALVQEERLIPFVGAYVDDVDLSQRCITVDWGLDY